MSSTGLMSCVRENSPPIEMAASESGAFSLPNNDSQKRRRFHPLRNLRRIFRRRTLSGADALGSAVSSTPSSPLSQTSQASFTSSRSTTSPPTVIATVLAHNASCCTREGNVLSPVDVTTMSLMATGAAFPPSQSHPISLIASRDAGSCGLTAVAPSHFKITPSASGGYLVKNACDNAFSRSREPTPANGQDIEGGRDMMDYQRSLSEGRLVDSDYSRETLSQSRDSVFSESATASSLSLGLKAELFDVLRKRRNRPDASEEDLGLPRSPTTPQRKEHAVNQSELSSLSLLSMGSSELDEDMTTSANLCGGNGDKSMNSSFSSSGKYSSLETSRTSDEMDLDVMVGSRLSHSAAHHKMAVRPKKKGPTRHRRPKESTILPSTPEVNEDLLKLSVGDLKETNLDQLKTKSNSLPPGVNAKVIEQHSTGTLNELSVASMKRSKTETTSVSSSCVVQSVRSETEHTSIVQTSTLERKDEDDSFLMRFLHRGSKKVKRSPDEGDHADQTAPSITVDDFETMKATIDEIKPIPSEITRKELASELKSGLNALLNSTTPPPTPERNFTENPSTQKYTKPRSGPAARQRVQPKDLSVQAPPPPSNTTIPELSASAMLIESEKQLSSSIEAIAPSEWETPPDSSFSKPAKSRPISQSDEENKSGTKNKLPIEEPSPSLPPPHEHFEKKDSRAQPKIVGLSPFQQKMFRVEYSTLDSVKPIPKQRKSVEKSKSFRYYDEAENPERNLKKRENMPSLPDLSCSKQFMGSGEFTATNTIQVESKTLPSMGFEINDNNLMKQRKHEDTLTIPSQGSIYTKNIIVSTAKPSSPTCNKDITEIEESIDKLVKSPFVTLLKSEETTEVRSMTNVSTTIIRNTQSIDIRESLESTQTYLRRSDRVKSKSSEILSKSDTKTMEKERINSLGHRVSVVSTDSSRKKKLTLELLDLKIDPTKVRESITATTPTKSRRSSAFFESKPAAEGENVPEFMKIQLNRVDSNRPKSNVVLSKNAKTPDTEDRNEMNRRFSNESVEITTTKPPLPPETTAVVATPICAKRNSLVSIAKQQEETSGLTFKSPVSKKSDDAALKSPTKNVDEENNILRNNENIVTSHADVTIKESKPKYLKKIEDQKIEKRKAVIETNRESIEKETGVVLRKKSLSASNQTGGKEDTPELMKVFARRSLKIKDTDDTQNFDDTDRSNTLKKSGNLDSDKENQSSSEEKLDKLPNNEITIQPKPTLQTSQVASRNDDKLRTSVSDIFRKPSVTTTLINTTTPKPFVQPVRYNSVASYRAMSTVFAESKKSLSTSLTTSSATISSAAQSNQSFIGSSTTSETIVLDENERNNNSTAVSTPSNVRHTIGTSSPVTSKALNREDTGEFKGILQRRAEWEQRAKEASK